MRVDFDIIVVGGGLVGGACALDLAIKKPKFKVALLEKLPIQPVLSEHLDNKIYAISLRNVSYLKKLGVWPTDSTRVGTIAKMNIFGDSGGELNLEATSIQQLFLAQTIESNNLQKQIYLRLNEMDNVQFIYDELDHIEFYENYVKLQSENQTYVTRLVIGADGANSFVRRYMPVEVKAFDYRQLGIIANFYCEKPHFNTAYQWFKGGDILAYLPLPNRSISIVWSTSNIKNLLTLPDQELANKVMYAGNSILGKLELATSRSAFPLRLQMLNKTYANNVVLIGDAAHTIHPLAGMGVNLGFNDSELLAKTLSLHSAYQLSDIGILARYHHFRMAKVCQMQMVCDGLFKLFRGDYLCARFLRNSGLNFVNSINVIKKYLITQALNY